MSTTTDTRDDSITTTFEVGDHTVVYGPWSLGPADETAPQAMHTHLFVTDLLKLLDGHEVDTDTRDSEAILEAAERVEDAFQTGQQLRDSAAYESFLLEGPDALPEELREALADDVATVAAWFGVDLDVPGSDTGDAPAFVDHLAGLTGWRGA